MSFDKIDKVKKIGKSIDGLDKPLAPVEPNKEHFAALMRQDTATTQQAEQSATQTKPSLMEEASKLGGKIDGAKPHSTHSIIAQAEKTIKRIEIVKEQLRTPNLELKTSVEKMLGKKLDHIDKSIKAAMSKTGAKVEDLPAAAGTPSREVLKPVHRFLGMLSQGQSRLENLSTSVAQVGGKTGQLSPAAMLAIQIKVTRVQQEIELFSNLLNKALESMKTIMNIQV